MPTCAADERGYKTFGGYWKGAVWAPTNTMVIRGLEKYGHHELAREIAMKHIGLVSDVCADTGTIWENYAPDKAKPGRIFRRMQVRKDFVGWSGIGPILYLLEHAIGLRPSAPENLLTWNLVSEDRCGCRKFLFNGLAITLVAERVGVGPRRAIAIDADGPFELVLRWKGIETKQHIAAGHTDLGV